jgi:hypothetical protein
LLQPVHTPRAVSQCDVAPKQSSSLAHGVLVLAVDPPAPLEASSDSLQARSGAVRQSIVEQTIAERVVMMVWPFQVSQVSEAPAHGSSFVRLARGHAHLGRSAATM